MCLCGLLIVVFDQDDYACACLDGSVAWISQDLKTHEDGNAARANVKQALGSAKTTAWNKFSSTMTSAIICLATNQKFNFSKYIFDNMVKKLEGGVNFLMFPRFVKVFLDKQVEGMFKHKEIYVTPSHTKKRKQKTKKPRRKDTELPHISVPTEVVADEAVYEEMYDSVKMAANTATGLDVEQDRDSSSSPALLELPFALVSLPFDPSLSIGTIFVVLIVVSSGSCITIPLALGVTLVDKDQWRNGQVMFDAGVLDDEEVVAEKEVSTGDLVTTAGEVVTTVGAKVSAATTTPTISIDDITLAKALAALKKEEERLKRQKEEEANIALIAEWDDVQAMMDADHELAKRLQAEEQGELSIEERSKLFVELINQRKNHFVRLTAEERGENHQPKLKRGIKCVPI
nr:ribonuclease H-like domain, reverse transcriptase, RNA-dependent DNA polymerase [Tanacetum cinerariifolium]